MIFTIVRHIYTFFLYLAIPFILARLYWKGRRLSDYRNRLHERFFLKNQKISKVDVWVHAVSLGEVNAATPLVEALLAQGSRVLITTMTPTGSQQVQSSFSKRVSHQYVPYDLPWVLRRFFKTINIQLLIIMETELWPNLIVEARRRQIPIFLANARLSEGAYNHYKKGSFLFAPLLNQLSAILVQSDEDAKKYRALGASDDLIAICGNLKFDLQQDVKSSLNFLQLKTLWGLNRSVVIAASTHNDEEHQLLSRLHVLKKAIPDVIFLIAPRHPERFELVHQLCHQLGLNTGLRSVPSTINTQVEVVVLDSLGELSGFYQVSDFAFVGGSLVPIGGHNVLEAIAQEVPVFTGPFVNNAKAICDELCKNQALQLVQNADELMVAIIQMHKNSLLRKQQITNANAVLLKNKGSVDCHMKKISAICKGKNSLKGS